MTIIRHSITRRSQLETLSNLVIQAAVFSPSQYNLKVEINLNIFYHQRDTDKFLSDCVPQWHFSFVAWFVWIKLIFNEPWKKNQPGSPDGLEVCKSGAEIHTDGTIKRACRRNALMCVSKWMSNSVVSWLRQSPIDKIFNLTSVQVTCDFFVSNWHWEKIFTIGWIKKSSRHTKIPSKIDTEVLIFCWPEAKLIYN